MSVQGASGPPTDLLCLPPQSYLLMATVIFLPYVSKVSSWCKGRLMGRPRAPGP